jgi:hypothetical protein
MYNLTNRFSSYNLVYKAYNKIYLQAPGRAHLSLGLLHSKYQQTLRNNMRCQQIGREARPLQRTLGWWVWLHNMLFSCPSPSPLECLGSSNLNL